MFWGWEVGGEGAREGEEGGGGWEGVGERGRGGRGRGVGEWGTEYGRLKKIRKMRLDT